MSYIITEQATKDLMENWFYIAKKNSPEIADEFYNALFEQFDLLGSFPNMGTERTDLTIGRSVYFLPNVKYKVNVFYTIVPIGVRVVRVLGQSKKQKV